MSRLAMSCLAVIFLGASIAYAETGQAPSPGESVDVRLDQKVSIKAIGRPLGDFLAELSTKTGVRMTASKDVADDKLVVLTKDVPLSNIMDGITQVLHVRRSRAGQEGAWKYEFWQDLKTKQEIEALMAGDYTKLRAYMDKLVKSLQEMDASGVNPAALMKDLESKTPEESMKIMSDPVQSRKIMAYTQFIQPGMACAVAAYGSFSKSQQDDLWNGQTLTLDMESVSPGLRQKIQHYSDFFRSAMASAMPSDADPEWAKQYAGSMRPMPVTSVSLRLDGGQSTSKPTISFSVDHPQPERAQMQSGMYGGPDSGSIDASMEDMLDQMGDMSMFDMGKDGKPGQLQFTFEKKDNAYAVMGRLLDKFGICAISDYFTRNTSSYSFAFSEMPEQFRPKFSTPEDVLKLAAQSLPSDLRTSGPLRLLTSKTWYLDRRREIPERLVLHWKSVKEQYGGLRLREAFELADLSTEQLGDLRSYGLGEGSMLVGEQNALQAVRALSASQWDQAMTEEGLPVARLNNAQFDLVLKWATQKEESMPYLWSPRQATADDPFGTPEQVSMCTLKIHRGELDEDEETTEPGAVSQTAKPKPAKKLSPEFDTESQWNFELCPPEDPVKEAEFNKRMQDAFQKALDAAGIPMSSLDTPTDTGAPSPFENETFRNAYQSALGPDGFMSSLSTNRSAYVSLKDLNRPESNETKIEDAIRNSTVPSGGATVVPAK